MALWKQTRAKGRKPFCFSMLTKEDVFLIKHNCQQFLAESCGIPMLKNLPNSYGLIKRVKVRYKQSNDVGSIINEAFNQLIFERAVFCNGPMSFDPILDERVGDYGIYYVIPPDGYLYLHNPAVNSITDNQITDTLDHDILTELFKFSYSNTNLVEALDSPAQIIMYNIPYFYCINAEGIEYDDLLSLLA